MGINELEIPKPPCFSPRKIFFASSLEENVDNRCNLHHILYDVVDSHRVFKMFIDLYTLLLLVEENNNTMVVSLFDRDYSTSKLKFELFNKIIESLKVVKN